MPAEQMQSTEQMRMETVSLDQARVNTEQPRPQEPMSSEVGLRGGGVVGDCVALFCACEICEHCC